MSGHNSRNNINSSNKSTAFSRDPLDLNGDGKNDAADDALRFWYFNQALNGKNKNPGPSSRGCCGTGFIVVLIILIPILIIAGIQSCSSGGRRSSGSFYTKSGTKASSKSKTYGKNSTAKETKRVIPRTDLEPEEYISGMFPAQGYYVTDEALAVWTYDKAKAGDKNQYYKYSYGEFYPQYDFVQIYIIWLNDEGYIAHVNAAGKNVIPQASKGRSTKVYDVTPYSTAKEFYERYKDQFHGFSEAEQYYNLHDWIRPYVEKYGKSGSGSSSVKTTTPKPAKKVYNEGLETDNFDNPDDFYEWYKDDFIDYEEAEEYWAENQ